MTSRRVQMVPPRVRNGVNEFDNVSTCNCDSLPHGLQRMLVFFHLLHILHFVDISTIIVAWQLFS